MRTVTIDKRDNVGIVLERDGAIAYGHKIALKDILKGEAIIKYGVPIGEATSDICKGEWVHTHNMGTLLDNIRKLEYRPMEGFPSEFFDMDVSLPVFSGYRRSNGQVGIRNDLWIVPTVGCVNKTAERIRRVAVDLAEERGKVFDNILCLIHPFGCSRSEDYTERMNALLKSTCCHPNAAGVLLVGLGCEHNTPEKVLEGIRDRTRIRAMVCQEVEDEEAKAKELIGELMNEARECVREDIPVSELILGVKCGGSDGLSGVTANPLTGRVMDRLLSFGGSGIMAEIPEMFGAEHVVLDRCESEELFNEAVAVINDMKRYYIDRGIPISSNPSPGNKSGGITTLEEKSMGCVQKGGAGPIRGVTRYGQRISVKGLNIIESPGNDLVSTTAIAAAGAHLILFTTGRGTPMGGIIPTIKLSSNTDLYERKKNSWIDFDAGRCLHPGQDKICEKELWNLILDVASGRIKTHSEIRGNQEFTAFQTGVTY